MNGLFVTSRDDPVFWNNRNSIKMDAVKDAIVKGSGLKSSSMDIRVDLRGDNAEFRWCQK